MPPNKIERFSRGKTCPICGGSDSDHRGQGTRCFGFLSSDREWVHCSREEHAGKARFHSESSTWSHKLTGPCPCGVEHAPSNEVKPPKREVDHVYKYRDAAGVVVFEVVRYRNPKSFAQRRPNGGGKPIWGLGDVQPILYNLPALTVANTAETVWIVEGEKDVDRLGKIGMLATCNPMGAGKWRDSYSQALVHRHVVIIADNDKAGRWHALEVAESLRELAASVRVLELPGLPEKGDVSDWLNGVPDSWDDEQCARELFRLASQAGDWESLPREPEPEPEPAPKPNGNGHIEYDQLSDEELGLINGAAIREERIDWLWEYRLACGEMALVAGEGGVGKSQVLMAIASTISTGGQWPDGSGMAPLGRTVILSAEDSPSTTIVPRLRALGADLNRITIVKAKVTIKRENKPTLIHPVSLQSLDYWRAVFDRLKDTLLFIVDPVPSYLGTGVNDRQNAEVRMILEPFLDEIVRPRGICWFCNTHLNKGVESKSPIHRVTGSIAYANLPRNVHFAVRDPEKPDLRYFTQVKCNNAPDDLPSLGFRIEQRKLPSAAGEIETSIPVFREQGVKLDLMGLMGQDKRKGPMPLKTDELAEWLWNQLQAGAKSIKELVDQARDAGYLPRPSSTNLKPSISLLYQARDRIAEMHDGNDLENTEVQVGTRSYKGWKVVRVEPERDPETPY